jgi:hypothetical protein
MTKQERIIAKQSELINHLSEAFIYQSNDELVEFHFKRGKLESELKKLQSEPDKYELREELKCDHPKENLETYHDGCIICTKCNCVISQLQEGETSYPKEFVEWYDSLDNPFSKIIPFTKPMQYVNFFEGSEKKYLLDDVFEYWKSLKTK